MKHDYKDLIGKLENDNITVREQKEAREAVHARVQEIWTYIFDITPESKLNWWSFSTDHNAWENTDYSDGGEFDPGAYRTWVELIGEWDSVRDHHYIDHRCDCGFETDLMWDEDWQNTIKTRIQERYEIEKNARANRIQAKKQKQSRKDSEAARIKSKLTTEEWGQIKHIFSEDVR